MNTTLNQSNQTFNGIGFVNEFDLVYEPCEIRVKDNNGDSTKQGERIRGKVSLRINNGIKTFDVFCNNLTTKGVESRQWKNALSWLELTPEINSTIINKFYSEEDKRYNTTITGDRDNASIVSVAGRITENRYFNTITKDASVNLRWNVSRISSSKITEEDKHGCTLSGNFFIKSITPETNNDEETGRLKVTLVAVGYDASPILMDTIVDEELAESFQEIYEVGQTASFDMDVIFEHIGAKTTTQKAFGKAGSIKASGYDREIMMITGGDEPIEESEFEDDDGNPIDNGYINPKVMKKALQERENILIEIKNNGENSNSNSKLSGNSFKSKKEKATTKKSNKTPPVVKDENDDSPFDDDFDDDEDF